MRSLGLYYVAGLQRIRTRTVQARAQHVELFESYVLFEWRLLLLYAYVQSSTVDVYSQYNIGRNNVKELAMQCQSAPQ